VFARKAGAQRFLTEMENSKLKGAWTNPALGRVLFREWFAEWQRTTARLRPNTEARDEWLFRLHVLPHFGTIPLAGIGQRDVRAWVAELIAKELAASTVQRCYQLLSKVMAAAVDAGMLPARGLRGPAYRRDGRAAPGPGRPGSLRAPVPEGGPEPPRAAGRHLVGQRRRTVEACGPSAAPAGAERLRGPVRTAGRRVDLRCWLVGVTGLEPVTSSL
jgi:hypothetical protein